MFGIKLFVHFVTIIAFICIILHVIYNRIQSPLLALLVVVFSMIYILISWILDRKYPHRAASEPDLCVTHGIKKNSGVFFNGCLDIWHIYHVLLWLLIGLLLPGKYFEVLAISIFWEGFEHVAFKSMKRCSDVFCGRVEDVFSNMLGYIIGSLIVIRYY